MPVRFGPSRKFAGSYAPCIGLRAGREGAAREHSPRQELSSKSRRNLSPRISRRKFLLGIGAALSGSAGIPGFLQSAAEESARGPALLHFPAEKLSSGDYCIPGVVKVLIRCLETYTFCVDI